MTSESKTQEWRSFIDPINNKIYGTKFRDTLSTRAEGDVVFGLGSGDKLSSAFNRTALIGGEGNDKLTTDVTVPSHGSDPVHAIAVQIGDSGHDTLEATVVLEGGNTTTQVGQLRATVYLDGGSDNDVIKAVAKLARPTAEDVTAETRVLGGEGNDQIDVAADTRGALDTNFAKNTVDGGSGDDHIKASAQSEFNGVEATVMNVLVGGDGDDVLDANARGTSIGTELVSNSLRGGRGDDVLRAFNLTDSDMSSPVGINELWGGTGADVLEAIHSTDGENALTDVTNRLYGGKGNDRLTADSTAAGAQVSALNRLKGGDGLDILSARLEAASNGAHFFDRELYDVANVLSGGAEDDRLEAFLSVTVPPHEPDGSRAENRLHGDSGDDILIATVAAGSVGTSLLYGGSGNDRLTVVGGTGNVLDGGQGKDRLISGIGDDHMTGGLGADWFVFAPQNGHDTVDFVQNSDKIDLTAYAAVGIHGFADLDIDPIGGNSVVRFDASNDITVVGVDNLRATDFLFA